MSTRIGRIAFATVLSGAAFALSSFIAAPALAASDHDDTPLLKTIPRGDARITDLYAFTRGDRLALIVCLDPTVPTTATEYLFASDLTVRIFLDNTTRVTFDNAEDTAIYGGTIRHPRLICEDITFEVTFDEFGQPRLRSDGLSRQAEEQVRMFAGLRDDPFIRGPRIGRNVAGIVIDLPLRHAVRRRDTLLAWATASAGTINGPFHELGGRALRSQFVENDLLNTYTPAQHASKLGLKPDVIIYDTNRPAAFPNGRELGDDVVDLVGDERVLSNDTPFPSENDVPFLPEFPYLAAPHPAH